MKITMLTGHLAKERHSLLFELAEDLSFYGAEVTVVTGFPSRRISEDVRDYYLNHPVEKINDRLTIKRVGTKKGEGKGLFNRFIKYLFLSRSLKKEALKIETDVYYIYSSPPFLGYFIASLKKKAPVVYNAQDIFPDSLFAIKPWVKKTPFGLFLRVQEKKVYKRSSAIITISEAMKKTIKTRNGNVDNIFVVYNWSDFNTLHYVSREENKLFDEYCIPKDKFIISYGGDIGLFQNWPVIIDAAERINSKDILFVFFGNGSQLTYVKEEIEKRSITNIMVLPMQTKDKLSSVYSLGDLELVSLSPGLTSFALPSKLYNIFACVKPVLAMIDKDSEYFDLINNDHLGFAIEPNNPNNLVNCILQSIRNNELSDMGINGHDYLVNTCSRKQQTKKYYDIIVQQKNG